MVRGRWRGWKLWTLWGRAITSILLVLLLMGTCVGLLRALENMTSSSAENEKLYFPSGYFLREATVGFRSVVADYLWFQTIQYYGSYRQGEHDLRYFQGLVDGVVQLDPHFIEAYYFGSLVASVDQQAIPYAVDLLKRGILANPDRWLLPFHIGFLYYVLEPDYERAALWFHLATQSPDANDFVRRFAAFARKKAGNLEGSIVLWQHLYDTTSNPAMKELAERMITHCEESLRQHESNPDSGGL